MAEQKRRIIVTVEGGLVERIFAEGIDASDLELFIVDYDTDNVLPSELLTDLEGRPCGITFWSRGAEKVGPEFSAWLDTNK